MYYLNARYYDPTIGRFLSKDPVPGEATDRLGQNPYIYVANNPVNLDDPSGTLPWWLTKKGWKKKYNQTKKAVEHKIKQVKKKVAQTIQRSIDNVGRKILGKKRYDSLKKKVKSEVKKLKKDPVKYVKEKTKQGVKIVKEKIIKPAINIAKEGIKKTMEIGKSVAANLNPFKTETAEAGEKIAWGKSLHREMTIEANEDENTKKSKFPEDRVQRIATANYWFDILFNAVVAPAFHFDMMPGPKDSRLEYSACLLDEAIKQKRKGREWLGDILAGAAQHPLQDYRSHVGPPWEHIFSSDWDNSKKHPQRYNNAKGDTQQMLEQYFNL